MGASYETCKMCRAVKIRASYGSEAAAAQQVIGTLAVAGALRTEEALESDSGQCVQGAIWSLCSTVRLWSGCLLVIVRCLSLCKFCICSLGLCFTCVCTTQFQLIAVCCRHCSLRSIKVAAIHFSSCVAALCSCWVSVAAQLQLSCSPVALAD